MTWPYLASDKKKPSFGDAAYCIYIKAFETWCHTSQLVVNVSKMNEVIF